MKSRFLLTSLLFLSVPADALLSSPRQSTPSTKEASVARIEICRILRLLRDKDRLGDASLAGALLPHARGEVEFLLDVLESQRIPALGASEVQVLSKYQTALLLETLASLGRSAVVDRLRERLLGSPGRAQLTLSVRVLGAVGGRSDLRWLLSLASVPSETDGPGLSPEVLEEALSSLLEREPEVVFEFESQRRALPLETLRGMVRATGRSGDSRGLAFLADVLHWNEELAAEAMAQIAKLGPTGSSQVNQEAKLRVRTRLEAERPMVCRAAALAAARLRDFEALPTLIELLACEDQGLRANVHAALRQLTGKSFAPEAERWNLWFDREQRWILRERAAAFRALGSQQPAEVIRALGDVLQHPTVEEDLIVALHDLLEHRQPTVRALACGTLADLSAEPSLGALTALLDDPAPEVVEAARRALARLTGQPGPDLDTKTP